MKGGRCGGPNPANAEVRIHLEGVGGVGYKELLLPILLEDRSLRSKGSYNERVLEVIAVEGVILPGNRTKEGLRNFVLTEIVKFVELELVLLILARSPGLIT